MSRLSSVAILACLLPAGCAQPVATPEAPDPHRSAYEHIMSVLRNTRVDVNFADLPLEEAFEFIEEASGLTLRVQWLDLEADDIDSDTPVNVELRDAAVADVLDAVLESVGADRETILGYEPALVVLVSTRSSLPERPCKLSTTAYNDATYEWSQIWRVHPTRDASTPSGVYIPENLEDCFAELKRMLHPDLVERMKSAPESDLIQYHFGLGMWIRNQWGLWGESRLEKYFTNLGLTHADDMSGTILDSFWRHLNGLPLRLNEQIADYETYWRKVEQEGSDESGD